MRSRSLRFMADEHRERGELVDALYGFDKALAINPSDAATLLDMGQLFAALDDAETT